jgi:DnaJ family protein C protein 7
MLIEFIANRLCGRRWQGWSNTSHTTVKPCDDILEG